MEKLNPSPTYRTERLDHLGLVSGVFQDLGLVDLLNSRLVADERSHISYGQLILAMVINGLGFTTRPMYLSPSFFAQKPVDLLIGPGVVAEDLNDYQYGKVLEAIYAYGTSGLFEELSSSIFLREGLDMRVGHYDTTSMSVQGQDYATADDEAISVTFGYSKDHRSDLRQLMLGLMVEPQYGIPWLFKALDGNTSDQKHFETVIKTLQKEAKEGEAPMLLVADSSLFSEEGLKQIDRVHYVTRVPHSFGAAQEVLAKYAQTDMVASSREGYWYKEIRQTVFGRKMRWLVVYSEAAHQRETHKLNQLIERQQTQLSQSLQTLARQSFECQADAKKAAQALAKKYTYLKLDQMELSFKNKSNGPGRPKKGAKLKQIWRIKASCKLDQAKIDQKRQKIGKFILATNQMKPQQMPSQHILDHYKDQYQVEKGFRFLKSPLCMADALFLHKPERIEAMAMVMCLALMVYALAERKLRETLQEIDEYIPDQKGKPTQKPTLRWVFQCFEGITVLKITYPDGTINAQVINLNVIHKQIIAIFGGTTQNIYTLAFSP